MSVEQRDPAVCSFSFNQEGKDEMTKCEEIRTLRSTRRGLETRHGRDAVTLADERARQQGTQTSTYTGAPVLDPTDRGDRGDVGIIRSPVRASVLPDRSTSASSLDGNREIPRLASRGAPLWPA